MPATAHVEQHFTASDAVRDVVIGMSDGLTVPFALAAGLSGAVASSRVVVTAGLAEIAAGAIAMGLGGFLAARSDAEHYASEYRREEREVLEKPDAERQEVADVLSSFGLSEDASGPVVEALAARPSAWVEFMMRFELGLEKPEPHRAIVSGSTIAASYVAGGFIPLAPYFAASHAATGLPWSVLVTLLALLGFGFAKGSITGVQPVRSALQAAVIGGIAAGAAFAIARLVS
jgi:VIT1/CCC1 family predicted Fe2+/Mn2+ transporter